jgi:hypothetical protein
MQLKTIHNHVQKSNLLFSSKSEGLGTLNPQSCKIEVVKRSNSRPTSPGCGKQWLGYDQQPLGALSLSRCEVSSDSGQKVNLPVMV